MNNSKVKHSRSSSNSELLSSSKVKLSEPLNITRESSNEKYNRNSKHNSPNVSSIKQGSYNNKSNNYYQNLSNDKLQIRINSNKVHSSLPIISRKTIFKNIKRKLFKETDLLSFESKENNNTKSNKLLNSKSTRRIFQIPSKNKTKELSRANYFQIEHSLNSRHSWENDSNEHKTTNVVQNFKKKQVLSLLYTNQFYFSKDLSDDQNSSVRRVQSFQGPYRKIKRNANSSLSVYNARNIVKIKDSLININHSLSAIKTYQRFPIKLKEKELLKKFAFKSQPGKDEEKVIKINQDSYLIKYKINGIKDFNMFGILDGHGPNGHHVSKFVTEFIYNYISKNSEIESLSFAYEIYSKLKEDNYKIIRQSYYKAEEELKRCEFDSNFSGTTCNIIFQIGAHIICSNVGDSRAMLVSKTNLKYENTLLSTDHKPTIQTEKKRIIKKGGRVEQYSEYGVKSGPHRVWLGEENYPGLAMSRSIGDLVASTVGVIPEPEFMEHYIMSSSKYIIVASDGVWEFLDNETVMNLTIPYYEQKNPQGLCDKVVEIATNSWEKDDIAIDDISIVAIFF